MSAITWPRLQSLASGAVWPSSAWRRAILLAVLAVLPLGIAWRVFGLPGQGRAQAVDRVRSAPDRLRAAHWFQLSLQLQLVDPDGAVHATTAAAAIDSVKDRAQATVPAVLGRPDLQIVGQGPILYLSIPVERQAQFGGARWVRVDAQTREAAAGARLGPLPGPVAVLDALRCAGAPTHQLDSSAAVRRTRVRLDLDHLPHTPDGRVVFNALLPLGRRFDAVVVFDGRRRLQQLVFSAPLPNGRRIDAMLAVTDVGEEVIIGVPPDSATVPAPTLDAALELVGVSAG